MTQVKSRIRNGWTIHKDERSVSFNKTVRSIVRGTEWWKDESLSGHYAGIFGDLMFPHIDALKNRRTAIDVGASYGFVSDALCQLFENVFAFELDNETRSFLKRNMSDYDNIQIHSGAGRRDGSVKAWRTVGYSGHTTVLPITNMLAHEAYSYRSKVIPIDSLGITDLDFMKIDVEGAEIDVLRGARNTLINNSPVLIIEISPRFIGQDPVNDLPCYYPGNEDEILNFLEPLGYEMVNFMAAQSNDAVFYKTRES